MNADDDFLEEPIETGSDNLLADDNLRLPDNANTLVRVHAVRAWLTRRQQETSMEIGNAALALQQTLQGEPQKTRLRRRDQHTQHQQNALLAAQQRLRAYEEAEALLEECISHTTTGERVLVEYYLTLEELAENATPDHETEHSPWLQALEDVQHRVEHVGGPHEE